MHCFLYTVIIKRFSMSIIRNNLKSVLDRIQVAIDQRPADVFYSYQLGFIHFL